MHEVVFKITISAEHKLKLDDLAEDKGISISELIEQLIDGMS
jgi:hypothetical protein